MLLSIITPVGREREWLSEAARSVAEVGELLGGVEWVLASDGPSTRWIDGAVGEHEHVRRIIVEPDPSTEGRLGRASLARNRGFRRATGELIGGLDDDDYFIPDAYAEMVRLANITGTVWAAGSFTKLVNGVQGESYPPPDFAGVKEPGAFRAYLEERRVQPFVGQAGVIRREWLTENGGWPVMAYHQDTQLWLDCTDEYAGIVTLDPVYVWRRHDTQMTPMDTSARPPLWR